MRAYPSEKSVKAIGRPLIILLVALLLLSLSTGYSEALSSISDSIIGSDNISDDEIEDYEFIFDAVIENATFVNEDIEFFGTTNTSIMVNDTEYSVEAPVNVTIFSFDSEKDYEEPCEVDGRGNMSFSCLAENRSSYTLISTAYFDDQDYIRFVEFNQDDIRDNLLNEDVEMSNPPSELNLEVDFEEVYENAEITGEVRSGAIKDENDLIVSVWPKDSDSDGYDERQECYFNVPRSYEFECGVNFTDSGTYEINVTMKSGELEDSVREITYYSEPSYDLRLQHEGVYAQDSEVEVKSYPLLGNRPFSDDIEMIVTSPEGVEYKTSGDNPRLQFIAEEEGIYEIEAISEHKGEEYRHNSKLVVAGEDMFGMPPDTSMVIDVRDFYAVNKEMKIPVELSDLDKENMSATIVITRVDGDELEISSVFTESRKEITYSPDNPGRYRITVNVDDLNLSSTRDIEILPRADYARNAVLEPMLENERAKGRNMQISNLVFDEASSSYDFSVNMSKSSSAHLRGIPSIDTIEGIQSSNSDNQRISTDIFAVDGLNVSEADIVLEKEEGREVEVIIWCKDWDYEAEDCNLWHLTDMKFEQNDTHIMFTVDSFSAYAGGDGFDSELTVWDSTSEDYDNETAIIDSNIDFYAEYLNFSSGESIDSATCEINYTDTSKITMDYNSSEEFHEYKRSFSDKGNYDYTVMCADDGFDDLSVSNSLDVYSTSYVDDPSFTRENLTLGYETGVSCKVTDAFSGEGISDYDVDFYSDLDGLIGSQSTDSMGWSSVNFEPKTPGTHNITCEIDDKKDDFYVSGNGVSNSLLEVYLSDIFIDKDMERISLGEYKVTLDILNYGGGSVYDFTVGDFVHEEFNTEFDDNPDSNTSAEIVGKGTMYFWNVGMIGANSSEQLTYTISSESLTTSYDISKNTVLGGTYHIS